MAIITIKKSITIHAEPRAVFEAITAFDRYSVWNPWVTRASGRCAEGELVTATRRWLGLDFTAHHRIVEMIFPEKMRWTATDWYRPLVNVERERLVFPCADGGTLYTVKLLLSGPCARVACWLARRSLRDGMRAETVALKQHCEACAAAPPAVVADSPFRIIRSADLSGEYPAKLDLS